MSDYTVDFYYYYYHLRLKHTIDYVILSQVFADKSILLSYSNDSKGYALQDFQDFLIKEQNDPSGNDSSEVSRFVREYLQDPQRDVQDPYFTLSEFVDFLFSKQNDIWDPAYDQVSQDMTRPLAHYWIASSHNTWVIIIVIDFRNVAFHSTNRYCVQYVKGIWWVIR